MERLPVVIAGLGPVGAVLALGLRRAGVPVVVLEAEPGPVMDQRAASTQPSTLDLLVELGLTQQMEERGLISPP